MATDIRKELEKRVLVIDGAMGTMIQRHKLTEADYRGSRFADWSTDLKGNNDLLCITKPELITAIHREYLEAGADIIETNTFNAQRISLADYGLQEYAYEINVNAARVAVSAAEEYRRRHPASPCKYVAGAIGPMNRMLQLSQTSAKWAFSERNP